MPDTTWIMNLSSSQSVYYAFIWNEANQVWNGTAYVTPLVADWAVYAAAAPLVPLAEGFSGLILQFPVTSPPGHYRTTIYIQHGDDPASTDAIIGNSDGNPYWDGTTFGNSPATVATNATLATYNNLIDSGTVDDSAPTATTFVGSSNLSADSNLYRTLSVCFTSGDLQSAKAVITSYNGATKRFTFATGFVKAPANGDSFQII